MEIYYSKNFLDYLQRNLDIYFQNHNISYYLNNKKWTKVISKENRKNDKKSIISKTLQKTFTEHKNVKFANEYYHVDNLLYEDINEGYTREIYKIHRWKLLAVVEHENQWDDWSDELVKLTYINAPLRVVISYGNHLNGYCNEITMANRIAEEIELHKYINESQEFLLIFGPRYKQELKNKDISKFFQGFLYDRKKGFIEI